MNFYDNSRLKDYRKCPRYYLLRHELGLTRESQAPALGFGLGWHSGMDLIWKTLTGDLSLTRTCSSLLARLAVDYWKKAMHEHGLDFTSPMYMQREPKRTMGVAHEMFFNYIQHNIDMIQSYSLVSVERPFAVPLGDLPNTYYIGRLDKEIARRGTQDIYIVDHKTTSAYSKAGGFRQDFLESFSPDPQVDGYAYAAFLRHGDAFRSVLIDAALVHKTEHKFFKIIPVSRTFSNLDAWLWEAEDWVRRIELDLERFQESDPSAPYLKAFPKAERCFEFFRSCQFKDLCRFGGNPRAAGDSVPQGYIYEPWNPFDVNRIQELGLKEV